MTPPRFSAQVALLTGVSRPLMRAVALALAAEGATLVLSDLNPARTEALAAEIAAQGGRALPLPADLSNKMAAQTVFYDALEAYGTLHLLIHHAVIAPTGALLTLDEYDWNRTLDTNLKSAFLCVQMAARAMAAQQSGGAILTIAAPPSPSGSVAYHASQAALQGFTVAAAHELAPHAIRVNALFPPAVESAPAADLIAQILSVCSPTATGPTGQILTPAGEPSAEPL